MIPQASFFSTLPVSVPAGRTVVYDITGRFLYVLECTDSFRLRVEDSEEIPAQAGLKYEVGSSELFKNITLRNPTVNTLQAILLYGLGDFDDGRITVQADRANQYVPFVPARSILVPNNTTSLADGANVSLPGDENRAAGLGQRLAIWVTNLHTTAALDLYDASAALNILKILANTVVRIPIGPQNVQVRNTSGATINCLLAEEFTVWTPLF